MRWIRMSLLLGMFLGSVVNAQVVTIDFGDTIEATLPTTGREIYQFSGDKGQLVTITLVSADFDAFLRLLDPGNSEVANDDDGAGNLNARIGPFRLPTSGLYTIVASSLSEQEIGNYSLTLAHATLNRIEYTQQVTGELTSTEPVADYMFTAQAGDMISIELMSSDFDAYLALDTANPRSSLTSDDDSGIRQNARIGPYILAETGNYIITVRDLFSETGDYTLRLNRVDPVPLALGEAREVMLTGSTPLFFSFEGHADQIVDVRVDSNNTLDTTLQLIGPDFYQIAFDDDSGGRADPALTDLILSADGTHFITVQLDINRDIFLPVTISVVESRLPSLDDGPVTIQLGAQNADQLLTFEGNANQQVFLHIVMAGPATTSLSITINQNGQQIAGLSTFALSGELRFGFVPPDNGPVTVGLSDFSFRQTELTVMLER